MFIKTALIRNGINFFLESSALPQPSRPITFRLIKKNHTKIARKHCYVFLIPCKPLAYQNSYDSVKEHHYSVCANNTRWTETQWGKADKHICGNFYNGSGFRCEGANPTGKQGAMGRHHKLNSCLSHNNQ